MSAILRDWIIPYVPRTKKNNHEIRMRSDGSRFVAPSGVYQTWEKNVAAYLGALNRWVAPISEPVNLKEVFYMPNAKRVDISNLTEAIDDALVRAGVIEDDNVKIVAGHEGSHVLIDRKYPRIEITITQAEDWQIFEEVKR